MVLRILVVEDDQTQNFMLNAVLKKRGYKVMTSFNGIEAIETLNHEKIDLVISDIDMEKMDGLQLKAEMNKNINWEKIPFIFLTSRSSSSTKNKASELGANLYLQKPCTINIIDEIEKIIIIP